MKFRRFLIKTLVLVGISVLSIGCSLPDSYQESGKRIELLNTSNDTLDVTFIHYKADGSLDSLADILQTVAPGESEVRHIEEGKYQIRIWDINDKKVGEDLDYNITAVESDPENEAYSEASYYFDLAQDKNFALVNSSYMYEDEGKLRIKQSYDGFKPFLVTSNYISNSNYGFLQWGEKFPEEIGQFGGTSNIVAVTKEISVGTIEFENSIESELYKLLPE